MEEETKEEKKEHRSYKIMEGDTIFVRRTDIVSGAGKPYTFYHTVIANKNGEGKKEYFRKVLNFKKNVVLEDNTRIKILGMFETVRHNPKDSKHPIWGLFISEFDVIDEPNYFQDKQSDIEEYQDLGIDEEIVTNW